jgi:hypothetical protein
MDIQCNNCQSYLNIREVVTRCTECKELIKPKTNNMKNNFKEKDTVYHYKYGEGKVIQVQNNTVLVQYENENHWHLDLKLLSFAPYKLEGFTQERPFTPEVGEYYYFWNDATIMNDAVGFGKLKSISNNEFYPYFFGTKYFQFCSDKNPLL